MSQFSYEQYQQVVTKAQSPARSASRIGYLKLADGNEALVRLNVSTLADLKFATVHAPVFGKKFEGLGSGFTPVSCLNEVGSYSDNCPFCRAAAEGHDTIGKAAKKVYIQMLVAYKDAATGQFSAPIPVVWERPAGYSKELAAKLRDYGDLTDHVFKLTRIGSGKDTRYSLDYIPLYDKPELVAKDFSAFDGFEVSKHSFWIKTAAELEEYLKTNSFAEEEQDAVAPAAPTSTYTAPYTAPKQVNVPDMDLVAPAVEAPKVESAARPVEEPKPAEATEPARPVRNFNSFSF